MSGPEDSLAGHPSLLPFLIAPSIRSVLSVLFPDTSQVPLLPCPPPPASQRPAGPTQTVPSQHVSASSPLSHSQWSCHSALLGDQALPLRSQQGPLCPHLLSSSHTHHRSVSVKAQACPVQSLLSRFPLLEPSHPVLWLNSSQVLRGACPDTE